MRECVRRFLIAGAVGLLVSSSAGASEARYRACLDAVATDPGRAEREADDWARFGGGGGAARHCRAMAMLALGAERPAALELLSIAASEVALAEPLRADILVQAAEVFRDIGDPVAAISAADAALRLAPGSAAALGVRGEARVLNGDLIAGIADFDDAVEARPSDRDLLLKRAAASRSLGRFNAARRDARTVIDANPGSARAWLELGQVERRAGEKTAARTALLRAVALDRNGPVGAAAQNALQRLEAGIAD